jgi:hypothetical protein
MNGELQYRLALPILKDIIDNLCFCLQRLPNFISLRPLAQHDLKSFEVTQLLSSFDEVTFLRPGCSSPFRVNVALLDAFLDCWCSGGSW